MKWIRNLNWKVNSIWQKEDYFIWMYVLGSEHRTLGKSLANFYTRYKESRQMLSIPEQSIRITQIQHF